MALLFLALVRQSLTAVEIARLHREREETLRETNAQMEAFLGIAGHELRNPLAALHLGLGLLERRLQRLLQRERVDATDVAPLLEPLAQADRQEERVERLVGDLVDVVRIRVGRLDLQLAPPDLATVVCEVVEEQCQVHPERTLVLECPEERRVPVLAVAQRLGQVVTNYQTNALKYSAADRPVVVGLQVDEQQARVWVRDQGPGLPPEEQRHIWDHFHRAQGIEVQSGSGSTWAWGCIFVRPSLNSIMGRSVSRAHQDRDRRSGSACHWRPQSQLWRPSMSIPPRKWCIWQVLASNWVRIMPSARHMRPRRPLQASAEVRRATEQLSAIPHLRHRK